MLAVADTRRSPVANFLDCDGLSTGLPHDVSFFGGADILVCLANGVFLTWLGSHPADTGEPPVNFRLTGAGAEQSRSPLSAFATVICFSFSATSGKNRGISTAFFPCSPFRTLNNSSRLSDADRRRNQNPSPPGAFAITRFAHRRLTTLPLMSSPPGSSQPATGRFIARFNPAIFR